MGFWRRFALVRWYRIICVAALLALASCSSPSVPRLPPADEEDETQPDSTKGGFLDTAKEEPSYWV